MPSCRQNVDPGVVNDNLNEEGGLNILQFEEFDDNEEYEYEDDIPNLWDDDEEPHPQPPQPMFDGADVELKYCRVQEALYTRFVHTLLLFLSYLSSNATVMFTLGLSL
jgi:hypothetical protein